MRERLLRVIDPNLVEGDNWPAIARLVGRARLLDFLSLYKLESQEYAAVTPRMIKEALAGSKSLGDLHKKRDLLWQRMAALSHSNLQLAVTLIARANPCTTATP